MSTILRADDGFDTSLVPRFSNYAFFQDLKTSGISGGASVLGFQTRDLTDETINNIAGASLNISNGQFTLPTGTYQIKARAPAYSADEHKCIVYDVTNVNTVLIGSSSYSNQTSSVQNDSVLAGQITVTGDTIFEFQHFISFADANGLGLPSLSGDSEIYSQLEIFKLDGV